MSVRGLTCMAVFAVVGAITSANCATPRGRFFKRVTTKGFGADGQAKSDCFASPVWAVTKGRLDQIGMGDRLYGLGV